MKILVSILLCQVLLPVAVESESCLLTGITLRATQATISDYSFNRQGQACAWTFTPPSYTDVLLMINITDVLSSNTCGTGNYLALHGTIPICSDSNGKCLMFARTSVPASCQDVIDQYNCSVTVLNEWNPRFNYFKLGTEQPAGFELSYQFRDCAATQPPLTTSTTTTTTSSSATNVTTSNNTGVPGSNLTTTTTSATAQDSSQLLAIIIPILLVLLFILGFVSYFAYKRIKSSSTARERENEDRRSVQEQNTTTTSAQEQSNEYVDQLHTYAVMKPNPSYGAVDNDANLNDNDDDEFTSDEDSDGEIQPVPLYTQVIKKK